MSQLMFPELQLSPEGYIQEYNTLFGIEFQDTREKFKSKINELVSQNGFQIGVPAYRKVNNSSMSIIWNGQEFELSSFTDYTLDGYIQFYTESGIYIFSRGVNKFIKKVPKGTRIRYIVGDFTKGTIMLEYFHTHEIEFFDEKLTQSKGLYNNLVTYHFQGFVYMMKKGESIYGLNFEGGKVNEILLGDLKYEEDFYPYIEYKNEILSWYNNFLEKGKIVREKE